MFKSTRGKESLKIRKKLSPKSLLDESPENKGIQGGRDSN
jgi:hypothetical protein